MQLERRRESGAATRGRVKIAVPRLPHIANFDDFDPLQQERAVELVFVAPGEPLPLDMQLLVLPGSKATVSDLAFLRQQGWDHDVHAYVRRGGRVLGICAGYQMLGKAVHDPGGIEGSSQLAAGLGLLDIETSMMPNKTLRAVSGVEAHTGVAVHGYEMHVGVSTGPATKRPMLRFDDGSCDGAVTADGRVAGCHVHGLFHFPEFRAALLASLGAQSSGENHFARVDAALDEMAAALERSLRLDTLLEIGSRAGRRAR